MSLSYCFNYLIQQFYRSAVGKNTWNARKAERDYTGINSIYTHVVLVFICMRGCVYFQSGCLWRQWRLAACCSCCWLGFAGVSVVLTPAAATSAAAAVLTPAAAHDTVSDKKNTESITFQHFFLYRMCIVDRCTVLMFTCTVYEAGKMAKSGQQAPVPVYPYYIPGVPTVVPLAPSSHVDPKISSIPSVENNLAAGECREGQRCEKAL